MTGEMSDENQAYVKESPFMLRERRETEFYSNHIGQIVIKQETFNGPIAVILNVSDIPTIKAWLDQLCAEIAEDFKTD